MKQKRDGFIKCNFVLERMDFAESSLMSVKCIGGFFSLWSGVLLGGLKIIPCFQIGYPRLILIQMLFITEYPLTVFSVEDLILLEFVEVKLLGCS